MSTLTKNHFSLTRAFFNLRTIFGVYSQSWGTLSLEEAKPVDVITVLQAVAKVSDKWEWIKKDIYEEERLKTRLADPHARFFYLKDGDRIVGYSFIVKPDSATHKKFWPGMDPSKVIEIENLALWPDEEGQGRGWAYFEQIMTELFKTYDVVYWSQSSSNYPTLKNYYIRKGMTFMGDEEVPDFRLLPPRPVPSAKPANDSLPKPPSLKKPSR